MKVMFFVHSLRRGGAEKLLLQIAGHLNSKGHNIKIVQVVDIDEYPEHEYKNLKKVSLINNHQYKWPYIFPKLITRFKEVTNEYNPDLICVFSPIMVIISAFSGISNKFIHVIQGYGSVARSNSLKQRIYTLLDKLSMRILNYDVIVPTESLKNAFINYISVDQSKITVIPSGIDNSELKPNHECVVGNKVNITMLGTVYKEKGQRYAIDVVKAYKKLYPKQNISVSIIGTGSDEFYIQEKISENQLESDISLLGRRDDAFNLIANSHIFWHLSESEGMPLVIMEAMALGIPAIGFDVRGVNDVIEHGVNGYLANFQDMEAIAVYTNELFLDNKNYKKFRFNARNTIDQKYTVKNMYNNYENYFLKVRNI